MEKTCPVQLNLKNIAMIMLMLPVMGCTNDLKHYYGRHGMLTSEPAYMGTLPQGDDAYSQGVRDGCNTAISIVGSGPMASTYEPIYYDINRSITDADYMKGRTLGFNYCTYYISYEPI